MGSATIAASLIDGLIGAGVTGFPEGRVTRRTADSQRGPEGCLDFLVTSGRKIALEVTGDPERIDSFIELMRPYSIKEMIRTGRVSMAKD